MKFTFALLTAFLLAPLAALHAAGNEVNQNGKAAANFDVTAYGAKGDGKTVNTAAIQRAIDACEAAGGGRVVIPAGDFLTSGIVLKSRMILYLERHAVLRGMPRLSDYTGKQQAFVYAENANEVGIDGKGTLDGSGSSYWVKDEAYIEKKEAWAGASHNAWKALPRPKNLRFNKCKGVTVKNITITNSPSWTLHVSSCDNVTISGITIRNPLHGPNTDGIDINMCRDVLVENCDISTGDDAIVLKCVSEEEKRVSRNIMVTGCRIETTCQALKIGTETLDGFENITFRDCTIYNRSSDAAERASAGIAIETVDGGTINGVLVSNITLSNVRSPIFIRLGNRGRGQKTGKAKPGELKNIRIENVTARHSLMESSITGIPGHPVEGVTLRNIDIEVEGGGLKEWANARVPEKIDTYPAPRMFGMRLPAHGIYCRHVKGLVLDQVRITSLSPEERPAFVCNDVKNLITEGLQEAPVLTDQP